MSPGGAGAVDAVQAGSRASPTSSGDVLTVGEEETTTDSGTTSGWKTLLFNCECHSFDDSISLV